MLSDYDDDPPVREVPNGPHYKSAALKQVQLAQMMRANEQVDRHGYLLQRKEGEDQRKDRDADKAKAREFKAKAKEERRRRYESTRELPAPLAAERLGVKVHYVYNLRKEFER